MKNYHYAQRLQLVAIRQSITPSAKYNPDRPPSGFKHLQLTSILDLPVGSTLESLSLQIKRLVVHTTFLRHNPFRNLTNLDHLLASPFRLRLSQHSSSS